MMPAMSTMPAAAARACASDAGCAGLQLIRVGASGATPCVLLKEGNAPELVAVPNAYVGYLVDRNYSPRTVRTYGFGLVAFCRWAQSTGKDVEAVGTDDLLSFLSACRQQVVAGRGGPNVLDLAGRRLPDGATS